MILDQQLSSVYKISLVLGFFRIVHFRCFSPSGSTSFKIILNNPTNLFSLLWMDRHDSVDIRWLSCYLPRKTAVRINLQTSLRSKLPNIKILLTQMENYTRQKRIFKQAILRGATFISCCCCFKWFKYKWIILLHWKIQMLPHIHPMKQHWFVNQHT